MKTTHNIKIIGIDHGYGNMKTGNCCFPTGITAYDHEPLFTADMLVYGGRYYLIGEGHKEFAPDKIKDEDYYVLTLAAIAKELKAENLTEAHIVIAAGLPLTWTSGQKADFKAYLMKNAEVEFSHKKADYHLYIDEVLITGTANIAPADLKIIKIVAAEYVRNIFRRLREHGYDENTMTLYVTGGGGCLIKNFSKVNADRVKFVEDICTAAKGYEYLAETQMKSEAKG